MVSCTECHRAKVKCSLDRPCKRCLRLGKDCVPRISNQGKRPVPQSGRGDSAKKHKMKRGEAVIAESSELSTCGNQHFGLIVLIRSWVAVAFRRRSFPLLSRATLLATQCEVSMDQIFCGKAFPSFPLSDPKPMDFLPPLICQDATMSQTSPSSFSWDQLPERLREKIMLRIDVLALDFDQEWIFAMRRHQGHVSFFVSESMEDDLVSFESIQATYATNSREVVSLFLSESSCINFHQALAKQLSLYIKASSDPPLTISEAVVNVGTGHNNPRKSQGLVSIKPSAVVTTMNVGLEIVDEDDSVICVFFCREVDDSIPLDALDIMSTEATCTEDDIDEYGSEVDEDILNRLLAQDSFLSEAF